MDRLHRSVDRDRASPFLDCCNERRGCHEYALSIKSNTYFLFLLLMFRSAVIRRLLEAKRPVEFDPRLRPLTEVNAESYGYNSLLFIPYASWCII